MLMQAAPLDDRMFHESREAREARLRLLLQRLLNVLGYLLAANPGLYLPPEHVERILAAQLELGGLNAAILPEGRG